MNNLHSHQVPTVLFFVTELAEKTHEWIGRVETREEPFILSINSILKICQFILDHRPPEAVIQEARMMKILYLATVMMIDIGCICS